MKKALHCPYEKAHPSLALKKEPFPIFMRGEDTVQRKTTKKFNFELLSFLCPVWHLAFNVFEGEQNVICFFMTVMF